MSWGAAKLAGDIVTTVGIAGMAGYGGYKIWQSRRRFEQSLKDLNTHRHVMGAFRAGKSTLMQHMIAESMDAGRGVMALDPHGSLADSALTLTPDNRIDDVIYSAPSQGNQVGLNPLKLYTDKEDEKEFVIGQCLSLLMKFTTNWGHKIEASVLDALWAVINKPNATLLDVMDACDSEVAQLRIKKVLSAPTLQKILTASNPINFLDVMNNNKIYICNMGRMAPTTLAIYYKMQLTQIMQAAFARHDRSPYCFLYFDEVQRALDSSADLGNLLTECGKYNIPCTFAHHTMRGQIPAGMERKVWLTGNHYLFRLEKVDAKEATAITEPEFDVQQLAKLPNYVMVKREVVGGYPQKPIRVKNDPPPKPRIEDTTQLKQLSNRKHNPVYVPKQGQNGDEGRLIEL